VGKQYKDSAYVHVKRLILNCYYNIYINIRLLSLRSYEKNVSRLLLMKIRIQYNKYDIMISSIIF
jgi:hypothetical protein